MSSKGYIWEDWSDEEGEKGKADSPKSSRTIADLEKNLMLYESESIVTHKSTVSSLGLESFAPPPRGHVRSNSAGATRPVPPRPDLGPRSSSSQSQSSSSNSNTMRLAEDVADRVSTLRAEVKAKAAQNKELQSELARLQMAKERKEQKAEVHWTNALKTLKAEQTESIRKMEDFVSKVETDVKKLRSQHDELLKKLSRIEQDRSLSLEQAKAEIEKKKQRARRQWEHEEKGVMDKALQGRTESLKKQAADALTPKLDAFVVTNKETVARLRQEREAKLDKLRTEILSENEKKLAAARNNIRKDLQIDLERVRETGERRLDELTRKHELEMNALREKFERDKARVIETYERTYKSEGETHARTVSSLRERESSNVQELLDQQQKELARELAAHNEAVVAAKASAARDTEQWIKQLRKQVEADEEARCESAVKELFQKVVQEADEVTLKLKDEAAKERKEMRARYEREIDDMRMEIDKKMEELRAKDEKLRSRSRSLKKEIEELKHDLAIKKRLLPERQKEIGGDLRPTVERLRDELHDVEGRLKALEDDFETKIANAVDGYEEEKNDAERQLEETLKKQANNTLRLKEERKAMEDEFQHDFDRIKQKIAAVLKKKDGVIESLKKEHEEILNEIAFQQEKLEELRSEAFA